MIEWFHEAIKHPWAFISLGLIYLVWRLGRYLELRLFNDKTGILTNYIRSTEESGRLLNESINKLWKSTKESIDMTQENFKEVMGRQIVQLEKLEATMYRTLEARPSDNDADVLLFINNPMPIVYLNDDLSVSKLNKAARHLLKVKHSDQLNLFDLMDRGMTEHELDRLRSVKMDVSESFTTSSTLSSTGSKLELVFYRYPPRGEFIHYALFIIAKSV